MRPLRLLLTVVFAILATGLANATKPGEKPQLDAAFAIAERALDEWNGGPMIELIMAAHVNLLEQDEAYAPSYLEIARIGMKTARSHSKGPNVYFATESMQFTRANLDHAIKLEPDYADAWVLYGYAATHDRQPYLGLLMLDKAELLGTDNAWLHLNRAQALETLDQDVQAFKIYAEAIKKLEPGTNEYDHAADGYARTLQDKDNLEQFFQTLIQSEPNSVRRYADLAREFLWLGRFKEAEEAAWQSLNREFYPNVVEILALSFYGQASEAIASNDFGRAENALESARLLGVSPARLLRTSLKIEGAVPAVPLIISDVADPAELYFDKYSPLAHAMSYGLDDAAKYLIRAGIGIHEPAWNNQYPLHLAVRYGMHDVLQLLLERGANPDAAAKDGGRPLNLAMELGDDRAAELLKNAGASAAEETWHVILTGIESGQDGALEDGIRFLAKYDSGHQAVFLAVEKAFLQHPLEAMIAAGQLQSNFITCTFSKHPDDEVAADLLRQRLTRARDVRATLDENHPHLEHVDNCIKNLAHFATLPRPLSVPRFIPSDQIDDWLKLAHEHLDKIEPTAKIVGVVNGIASALRASQPDNPDVRLLSARMMLMRTLNGELMAGQAPDSSAFNDLARDLDRILTEVPQDTLAIDLYVDVLKRQERPELANLLLHTRDGNPATASRK